MIIWMSDSEDNSVPKCISYPLLCNNYYNQLRGLKGDSVGQQSKHSSAEFSAPGSYKAAIKMLARAVVSLEVELGKDPLSSPCGCWENSHPHRQLTEGLTGVTAGGYGQVFATWAFPTRPGRERVSQGNRHCNLS